MSNLQKFIRKGLGNKKDYLSYTLKNGLRCLLISVGENEDILNNKPKLQTSCITVEDSDGSSSDSSCSSTEDENESQLTDSCAMSLCVNIGSFCDPIEAQGLAHLLEHMVSMGSERFPADNHFDRFLYRKAGYSNAETGCEYTNFHFEVPLEYFQEAADIFASMFQAPKLAKESIDKEKQVVDSEFQMALNDDDSRIQRLISMCADKSNPACQFFWGNLESLNDENLGQMVVDFWKKYYSASRMTLAIQSKQSTHEMLEWVEKMFSSIPTDNKVPPNFKVSPEPFVQESFHKLTKIISISSTKKIIFSWYLPPVIKLYKNKPLEYLAWIIGHEGKGTLISYLRQLNYAMELEAGIEDDFSSNSIYSLFSITIELTTLGLTKLGEVIELTFGYLNLIRREGISEAIFKQLQILAENDFNFAESKSAIDHVTELSENMLVYEEEDYISGPFLFLKYSPEIIQKFINLLTADRVAIFVLAKEFNDSDLFTKDPIFGTQYITESITSECEVKWSTIKPHQYYSIQKENLFLTTNFTILPELADYNRYPQKILENEYIELWYKQDTHFKLPKGYVMLNFISTLPSKSLENYICFDLFLDSIVFLLNEETYPAAMAQLSYGIRIFYNGFELTFTGFNEKLHLLINIVIKYIKDYEKLMTEKIFKMVKPKAINKLKNNQYDLDYVPSDLKNSLIQEPDWNLDEKLKSLEKLNYNTLIEFYKNMTVLYCQALIQGNIHKNEAINISQRVVDTLNYKPLDKKDFPVMLVKKLNSGENRIKLSNYNPNDNNSIAYKYYQFDKNNLQDSVKYYVLQSMVEESAFDELRTKQCLGYDVQFNVTSSFQHYGFYFKVAHQKKKFETKYVFEKMDEFLKNFWKDFSDAEEVDKVREALIALKTAPDDCLVQEFNRNRNEILENRFKFDRLELEIKALKILKFEDVQILKDGFLKNSRILSVEIIGNSEDLTNDNDINSPPIKKICLDDDTENYVYVKNFDEFKNTLKSY
ncbi:nardilysin-like [Daktulosphaira vitifoliae]|uniref:nardilysin-like n=1 Tax=Daktulosphaira vitifoliae TaxID=58002 RepID=UPI0021A9A42B|nr:nardilysin-like [Daktulosphaira vitifoliae]